MATWKKVKTVQEYMANVLKDIEKDQKRVLSEMAQDLHSMLYLYTQSWYNETENPSSTYDRTYEFINSLTIEFVSQDEVQIGFDPQKMSYGNNNNWRQHEDREILSQIIDRGWVSTEADLYVSNPPFSKSNEGSNALSKTIEYMKSSQFKNEIKLQFKKYGYNIKL